MADDRLLIIETSGGTGQVALALGTELKARRQLDQARRHARDLAPAVRDLLREQGWRSAEIAAVLVSRGPGSYTGLRVGIMSAKAFSYATGCAILGLDTFAGIALQAPSPCRVEVVADAQQEKVYCQRYVTANAQCLPKAETSLTILPLSQWLAQLPPDVWITGPGLRPYREQIGTRKQLAEEHWDPRPASLLQLGLDRLARGERDDCWKLEPLYLRPSSAEEIWASKHGDPGEE